MNFFERGCQKCSDIIESQKESKVAGGYKITSNNSESNLVAIKSSWFI